MVFKGINERARALVQTGMVVAPRHPVPSFTLSLGLPKKETAHVVDDSCDFVSPVVNRISWSHWRWSDSPPTCDRADRVHH